MSGVVVENPVASFAILEPALDPKYTGDGMTDDLVAGRVEACVDDS